ncbi:MAG: protoporphyrinogen oxidase HemJ [Gammaproteobacteria bacterium]|nr:protoporphyrinogen oxidase HemJ [Gammaproteobacteria bacterium]NNM01072.1 protoporphyrinogen oxidase HemJ [Gammaproteobacteria bacterium]
MLWVKAFHIIAMVTWFAGIFYLPRLFVYHAMSEDEISIERFKVMERKLYRGIMTPSAVLTVALGLWLIHLLGVEWLRASGWLHIKLVLVALLIGYHWYLGRVLRLFARDANRKSHVYYRWLNELPVLILVAVVILAVVKPAL